MTPDEPNHPDSERKRAEYARFLADVRATFTSDSGSRVLEWLESTVGLRRGAERPSFLFTTGPCDPLAAAFGDGRRSVLYEIRNCLAIPEDDTPAGPIVKKPGG